MQIPYALRNLLVSFLTLGVVLNAGSAIARPEAPGELQAAANMQCVPVCTMCHLTNPGQADNWTKPLGVALFAPIKAQQDIKPAYDAWAALPGNAAAAANISKGIEPGAGVDVCGPTYGCGAHVAKQAPPADVSGPLWVLGAVVVGGILRRRRKSYAP